MSNCEAHNVCFSLAKAALYFLWCLAGRDGKVFFNFFSVSFCVGATVKVEHAARRRL